MKIHKHLLATAVAVSLISSVQASDWYVDPGDNLQSVINQTLDGDRILCSPGTYIGSIRFQGKDIQIIGTGGSAVTFLDPLTSNIPTVIFDAGSPETATLQGFTVLSCASTSAGCAWISNSSCTFTGCLFTGSANGPAVLSEYSKINLNDCDFDGNGNTLRDGGAMDLDNCTLVASDSDFTNNIAMRGGGIYSYNSSLFLTDCLFDSNQAIYEPTGSSWDNYGGGGVFCEGNTESNASCHLNKTTFRSNYSDSRGGALVVKYALWTSVDCLFEFNVCKRYAGAVSIWYLSNAGTVDRTIFRDNQAGTSNPETGRGGAIRSYNSSTQFDDCVFRNNTATDGAAFYMESSAEPVIKNCIMTENVGNKTIYSGNWTYLTNVTLVNNVNPYNNDITYGCQLKNCIVWGPQTALPNTSASWSDIRNGGGGTNIDEYPMFVDRWMGDYSLLPGSPCIDSGDPNSPPDEDGTPADMGATGYVLIMENGDCNGNGISDGIDSLGNDCNANGLPDECDVASGLLDCNGNGINDCDDITDGTSMDCNMNGIPDECDIASGTSDDLNGNGIPDECESVGLNSCTSNPNSTGLVGTMYLFGSAAISNNDMSLFSHQLPTGVLGYYLVAPNSAYIPGFGGSSGILCLGGPTVRLNKRPYGAVLSSGSTGSVSLMLDYSVMPVKAQFQPGETWYFQLWHRDMENGVPTSNTTDASQVTFF